MADNIGWWGLYNPHPFSQMKTELIWEGKYDEYGNRADGGHCRCAMLLQKIETIGYPHHSAQVRDSLSDLDKCPSAIEKRKPIFYTLRHNLIGKYYRCLIPV
ncbi:MAG: hypothetical protein IMF20_01615 [Proteobacteria bacterium]|nr:hypothetical protein [Pseudomonadota bacterium]